MYCKICVPWRHSCSISLLPENVCVCVVPSMSKYYVCTCRVEVTLSEACESTSETEMDILFMVIECGCLFPAGPASAWHLRSTVITLATVPTVFTQFPGILGCRKFQDANTRSFRLHTPPTIAKSRLQALQPRLTACKADRGHWSTNYSREFISPAPTGGKPHARHT